MVTHGNGSLRGDLTHFCRSVPQALARQWVSVTCRSSILRWVPAELPSFDALSSFPVPSFRSSGSFGKRQEYIAVAELVRRGYDVYMTLVDDQQIDCVVRLVVGSHPVYIDVQIKARSTDAKQPGTFAALIVRDPRPNFMFVFYSEGTGTYWVMPSLDLVQEATRNKEGVNAGNTRLSLRT